MGLQSPLFFTVTSPIGWMVPECTADHHKILRDSANNSGHKNRAENEATQTPLFSALPGNPMIRRYVEARRTSHCESLHTTTFSNVIKR